MLILALLRRTEVAAARAALSCRSGLQGATELVAKLHLTNVFFWCVLLGVKLRLGGFELRREGVAVASVLNKRSYRVFLWLHLGCKMIEVR